MILRLFKHSEELILDFEKFLCNDGDFSFTQSSIHWFLYTERFLRDYRHDRGFPFGKKSKIEKFQSRKVQMIRFVNRNLTCSISI